ncbi:putative N-acetyltransferase HLS1 [Hordeum vulgare]|nr:putative N-acetyltransferase HLS1 [Hordeum vulgare]
MGHGASPSASTMCHHVGSRPDPARTNPRHGVPSFTVLSIWDQTRSLRLRVDGAQALLRHSLAAVRALDRVAPWLRVPSCSRVRFGHCF